MGFITAFFSGSAMRELTGMRVAAGIMLVCSQNDVFIVSSSFATIQHKFSISRRLSFLQYYLLTLKMTARCP